MEAELYGAEPGMVSLEGRVALSLQLEDAHVHEVDFDDLYVSEYVLKTLHQTAALIVAVSEARSDPRAVSHEDMRSWLLEIAAGNFTAPPPDARLP